MCGKEGFRTLARERTPESPNKWGSDPLPFTVTAQTARPLSSILEQQEDTGRKLLVASARCFLFHACDDSRRMYFHVTKQETCSPSEGGDWVPLLPGEKGPDSHGSRRSQASSHAEMRI